MPRAKAEPLYVGIKGTVLALDRSTGTELWRTKLKGQSVVIVHRDADNLYAMTQGEMFCVDPSSGALRWHNPLKGFGYGLGSMATDAAPDTQPSSAYTTVAEEMRRRQAAAAAAT